MAFLWPPAFRRGRPRFREPSRSVCWRRFTMAGIRATGAAMTQIDPTPLERAARAMYDNVRPDWDWSDPDAEPLRRMYRDNARVALMAVMEPSAAMIGKGDSKLGNAGCLAVWQAMVAAMLQGE
jgi:hypothetical protein